MYGQNENFNKERENMFFKNQTEISKLKEYNIWTEELISGRQDRAEKQISDLEDKSFEIIQSEEEKKKNAKEWRKEKRVMECYHMDHLESQKEKRERKGQKSYLQK